MYRELYDKYNGKLPPSDEGIRAYLLRDREEGTFNQSAVDKFIEQLRADLKYAGVTAGSAGQEKNDVDTLVNGNNDGAPKVPPQVVPVGAFVQWTSSGVDQLPKPRKVLGIQDGYAFVEGSQTGLPMSELSIVEQPEPALKNPPVNPFFIPASGVNPLADECKREGYATDRTTLDEGAVSLEWPDTLSADSVEEFQDWMIGRINRARRRAGLGKIKIDEDDD